MIRVPRPCLHPGCTRPAIGAPRCPPHQRAHKADYHTTAYRTLRLALIGRPCHWCGAPADTADHHKPLAAGGTWQDGLAPACKACNSSHKDGKS